MDVVDILDSDDDNNAFIDEEDKADGWCVPFVPGAVSRTIQNIQDGSSTDDKITVKYEEQNARGGSENRSKVANEKRHQKKEKIPKKEHQKKATQKPHGFDERTEQRVRNKVRAQQAHREFVDDLNRNEILYHYTNSHQYQSEYQRALKAAKQAKAYEHIGKSAKAKWWMSEFPPIAEKDIPRQISQVITEAGYCRMIYSWAVFMANSSRLQIPPELKAILEHLIMRSFHIGEALEILGREVEGPITPHSVLEGLDVKDVQPKATSDELVYSKEDIRAMTTSERHRQEEKECESRNFARHYMVDTRTGGEAEWERDRMRREADLIYSMRQEEVKASRKYPHQRRSYRQHKQPKKYYQNDTSPYQRRQEASKKKKRDDKKHRSIKKDRRQYSGPKHGHNY
jgi:hypothetical protein